MGKKPEQWCKSSYKVKGKIENIYLRISKSYRRDIKKVYPCDHSKPKKAMDIDWHGQSLLKFGKR